jgi:hypothetical protein
MDKPFECPLDSGSVETEEKSGKEEFAIHAIVKGKNWFCSYPKHPKFMRTVSECKRRKCVWLKRVC